MSLPVPAEAIDESRRILGSKIAIRQAWRGDNGVVFAVLDRDQIVAYLKFGPDVAAERARLEWLEGRLPVARVLSSGSAESSPWILLTPCRGIDLANLKHTESGRRIVDLFADALNVVHGIDAADCPFNGPGVTFVHGDACLPNFVFADDVLTGVLDVADCGLGDRRSDLATAVWSVQFNLGPGHAAAFLEAYGIDLAANNLELGFDDHGQECLRLVRGANTM